MSSGEVSTRTSITASPAAAMRSASSALNTTLPETAPGEAGKPLAMTFFGASGSSVGCSSWSSEAGSILRDRLIAVDQALVRHVDRDLERGVRGALAAAGLQDPEPAVLDGELDVLHVAVVRLEPIEHGGELGERLGHHLFHRRQAAAGRLLHGDGERLRRADAGDHVLALGIDQELAVVALRRRSTDRG